MQNSAGPSLTDGNDRQHQEDLLRILNKHQAKLTRSLESLLEALDPAKSQTLPATKLGVLAQDWFTQNIPAEALPDDPDQLHAIRLYETAGFVSVPPYNDNPFACFWGEKVLS